MNVFTASEMRECDRRTTEEYGIPGICLMESAGIALANACMEELGGGNLRGKAVTILCGKGNNGGDGFVAARYLHNAGVRVRVFLIGATADDLRGDAQTHFSAFFRLRIDVSAVLGEKNIIGMCDAIRHSELLVDCILGTGFRPPLEGLLARVVGLCNAHGKRRLACDIPSGIHADTGEDGGAEAFSAHRTVTLAGLKRGLLFYPGATHAGTITVAPIGIPADVLRESATATLTSADWIRTKLPPRTQSRDANKGRFGTVLVIAGAAGMAGAATLTGLSALRAGAGLVHLALPTSVLDTAAVLAPELVLHALPETPERSHGGEGALEKILQLAEKADAIALGPGLSGNTVTKSFVQTFVQQLSPQKTLVIDADGLNAIADAGEEIFAHRTGANTVLTPHPGEAGRLLHKETRMVQMERTETVREAARKYRATVLLKGASTLIATHENANHLYINRRGSVSLATAGSGDVLTGVLVALLADREDRLSAPDAARIGAFLHALAGEVCEKKYGAVGTIATEIRDALPEARRTLYNEGLTGSLNYE
ncbi:MAG: NAD(P)H-hydrate dehydratase [Fibrella sp.]|nr:NAD(P)H-hydrate dehydratase [Armatimonadota bacterium]